jgi:glycine dehydrogenase
VLRSYLGMGYHGTLTPPVIQRNVLENPGWYTAVHALPGRDLAGPLEALLNYQTLVSGPDRAAGRQRLAARRGHRRRRGDDDVPPPARQGRARTRFFVDQRCHPQTIAVVRTRAEPLGIEVRSAPAVRRSTSAGHFGALLQYPGTDGRVRDLDAARSPDATPPARWWWSPPTCSR